MLLCIVSILLESISLIRRHHSPLAVKGCKFLTNARHLRSLLSKEWSLSCYICCKTGLWFLWTRMKDHANVVVCFRKQGLIADDLLYLGSPREGWGLVPGEVLQWFVRGRFLKVLSNPCLSQGDWNGQFFGWDRKIRGPKTQLVCTMTFPPCQRT